MKKKINEGGFTLVEMLVVIGLIALLSTAVLVAVNPARQFKLARDSERAVHVNAILNAIGQNFSENKGVFTCGSSTKALPATTTIISSVSSSSDIASCIVPTYLASVPFDPTDQSAYFKSLTDYDTAYSIFQDLNGHITISAKSEVDPTKQISVTR